MRRPSKAQQRRWTVNALFVFAAINFLTGDDIHGYIFLGAIFLMLTIEALLDIASELRRLREAVHRGDL